MNLSQTIEQARKVCRIRRLSWRTENTYCDWLERFIPHLKQHAHLSREERVRTWLEKLAPHVSASTQNQALSAVLFLYRDVLNQPLQELGKWARAKRPQRLPTWLTPDEMHQLLGQMNGTPRLMAELAYGSGLRLSELLALRVKDIDLEACVITVHGGKGDKDRTTCLPRSLTPTLTQHLRNVWHRWEADQRAALPPVFLPDGLERKYPNAGTEWPWFWLLPAAGLSTDPRSKIVRRHHLHEDTLGKALKTAAQRARISKRISAHTLRHSFATAMLMSGHSIHELKDLLGHSSIETTQIYLHCLPNLSGRITSPLDQIKSTTTSIIPFIPGQQMVRKPLIHQTFNHRHKRNQATNKLDQHPVNH